MTQPQGSLAPLIPLAMLAIAAWAVWKIGWAVLGVIARDNKRKGR